MLKYREGALPPAVPLALGIRAVLRINSHFAFSPSSPRIIIPAEMEEGGSRSRDSRGWGGGDHPGQGCHVGYL